jgi:flavodoxin I
MSKIGIFYGSSTGNTTTIAKKIAQKLGDFKPELYDVAKATVNDVENCNVLIFGTSTWGYGDLQDDWESFLPKLKKASIQGKTVALFGLGDCESYADSFVDGMGTIFEELTNMEIQVVGQTPTSGYTFDASKAVVNSEFVGLALDEDNESDRTDERIDKWIENLKSKLK